MNITQFVKYKVFKQRPTLSIIVPTERVIDGIHEIAHLVETENIKEKSLAKFLATDKKFYSIHELDKSNFHVTIKRMSSKNFSVAFEFKVKVKK